MIFESPGCVCVSDGFWRRVLGCLGMGFLEAHPAGLQNVVDPENHIDNALRGGAATWKHGAVSFFSRLIQTV
jgi:hypothetical protein